MRNHEVTAVQKLLKEDGTLREPGWARQQVWQYSRGDIKACRARIKEWDYYSVVNRDFAVAFTISDDGYIGLQSVSFLDLRLEKPWEQTKTILNVFPMGRLQMPVNTSSGDVEYRDRKLHLRFQVKPGKRRIQCSYPKFYKGEKFSCDIVLEQPPMDTIVIATPWAGHPRAFYYNQKINCMPARGLVRLGKKEYRFSPETDFATLDWGRGVWTYDNTWYWASANGIVDGRPFGLNLGYGFGDTTAATENMLFYEGKAHKLGDVEFQIPRESYLKPWKILDTEQRLELEFTPILDRAADLNVLVIQSDQHQVFGRMNGYAILDDKRRLEIRDLTGFAEKVHNRY